MSRERFRRVFVVFLYVTKETVALSSPSVSPMYNFFAKNASYALGDIGRGTGEIISDLDGSLGSRNFSSSVCSHTEVLRTRMVTALVPEPSLLLVWRPSAKRIALQKVV